MYFEYANILMALQASSRGARDWPGLPFDVARIIHAVGYPLLTGRVWDLTSRPPKRGPASGLAHISRRPPPGARDLPA